MDKKEKELHDKAIRLLEGGIVKVDGLVVRAVKVPEGFDPCNECNMDCLCKGDIARLCDRLSLFDGSQYLLKLAYHYR